jgi:N-acetylmuramoyl-L-alanine amidase
MQPPGYHVVEQGDWLSKIAFWYGIPQWETIWNHANNASLREERPDPNLLYPGDKVYVPGITAKESPGATDQRHRFRRSGPSTELNLVLLDSEQKPRCDVPYRLSIDGKGFRTVKFEDKTDEEGRVSHRIPVTSERGLLEIDGQSIRLDLGHLDPIESVSGVQARLANLGYQPGPIDGIDGPLTRQAVSEFQADYPPLEVDGICGPKTRAKLKDVYGS